MTLDEKIADFIANPKLGDPQWERDWRSLLSEKYGKARIPTLDELSAAASYIYREYIIDDQISGDQWAEGLAFSSRNPGHSGSMEIAREAFAQLPPGEWISIAELANQMAIDQRERPRFLK